ncbi:MAG: carboxylating nicotinate-nucleotide diphosphorylase [Gammaproteobacteria bacterium]
MQAIPPPQTDNVRDDVARALKEDLGSGDVTALLVPPDLQAQATVISREEAVICGTAWFDGVFHAIDPQVRIDWRVHDGDAVAPDTHLCTLNGPARALLSGERTALNFLQTLSGTATRAQRFVAAVAGTGARILDTRKTLPGLRYAQKYAVRCGGGYNHRMGLYDAVLIKENHILAAGSIARAVATARDAAPGKSVEIEVETLEELTEARAAGADMILLDNFTPQQLREAVAINGGRAKLEASGGITLDNIRGIAETGVDYISVGSITKDMQAVDLSMRFSAQS